MHARTHALTHTLTHSLTHTHTHTTSTTTTTPPHHPTPHHTTPHTHTHAFVSPVLPHRLDGGDLEPRPESRLSIAFWGGTPPMQSVRMDELSQSTECRVRGKPRPLLLRFVSAHCHDRRDRRLGAANTKPAFEPRFHRTTTDSIARRGRDTMPVEFAL